LVLRLLGRELVELQEARVRFRLRLAERIFLCPSRDSRHREKRTGVAFTYVPVLLGGLFNARGNVSPAISLRGIKNKPEYEALELRRFIARHGIERFARNPPTSGEHGSRSCAGAVAGTASGCFPRYVDEVYRHMWAEPRRWTSRGDSRRARRIRPARRELVARARTPKSSRSCLANTERASRAACSGTQLLRRDALFFREGPPARGREEIEARKPR